MKTIISLVLIITCFCSNVTGQKASDLKLINAIKAGDSSSRTIRKLIRKSRDLDAKDGMGKSAVYWASYMGDGMILKRLVSAGADVNLADQNGNTPMCIAVCRRDLALVKQLLASGANVNLLTMGI